MDLWKPITTVDEYEFICNTLQNTLSWIKAFPYRDAVSGIKGGEVGLGRIHRDTYLLLCYCLSQGPSVGYQGRGSGLGTEPLGHKSTAVDDGTELSPHRAQVPYPRRSASLGEDTGHEQRSVHFLFYYTILWV